VIYETSGNKLYIYSTQFKHNFLIVLSFGSTRMSAKGKKQNDIITKVGDITIDETHSYVNSLFKYKPGDTIGLDVTRGGQTTQLQITLGEAKHQ